MSGHCAWQGEALVLWLRVQPKASRDEICGPHGEQLRVRITAPPVDGKANAHLLRFLAQVFGVSRAQVSLLQGESGRNKRVRIEAPQRLPQAAAIPAP